MTLHAEDIMTMLRYKTCLKLVTNLSHQITGHFWAYPDNTSIAIDGHFWKSMDFHEVP